MIQAKELRIGNFISYNGEAVPVYTVATDEPNMQPDPPYIVVLSKNSTHFVNRGEEDFDPIPLTEEWLLRFGSNEPLRFSNLKMIEGNGPGDMHGAMVYEFGSDATVYEKNGRWFYELAQSNDDYGTNVFTKEIKKVHHLMNLFFDLNDKELEIKAISAKTDMDFYNAVDIAFIKPYDYKK